MTCEVPPFGASPGVATGVFGVFTTGVFQTACSRPVVFQTVPDRRVRTGVFALRTVNQQPESRCPP